MKIPMLFSAVLLATACSGEKPAPDNKQTESTATEGPIPFEKLGISDLEHIGYCVVWLRDLASTAKIKSTATGDQAAQQAKNFGLTVDQYKALIDPAIATSNAYEEKGKQLAEADSTNFSSVIGRKQLLMQTLISDHSTSIEGGYKLEALVRKSVAECPAPVG